MMNRKIWLYSYVKSKLYSALTEFLYIYMDFTICRGSLLKSLSKLASIVEKRSAIPILSNVKISLFSLYMRLLVTDMDLYVEDEIELEEEVASNLSITVPMHMFLDIIKRIPEHIDFITMTINSADSSFVMVCAGTAKCKLPSLPAEEFPNILSEEYLSSFELQPASLQSILSITRYAVPAEDTRYYLNGIYIHILEKDNNIITLRAVATDGHRMACADTTVSAGAANMPAIIIPKKTVAEILKLLSSYENNVELSVSNSIICLKVGTTKLVSKLIDGKFLDYTKAIPSINKKIIEIDARELKNAINLVTSVSYDKSKVVRFRVSEGKLTLFTESISDIGAYAQQEIMINNNGVEDLDIAFNSRYVLDILSSVDDKGLNFCFSDAKSAALIRPSSKDNHLHVIMPMQL